MTSRLLITIALVLVPHIAIRLTAMSLETVRVRMPDAPIESVPRELGGWTGEDIESDEDWFDLAQAADGINRRYVDRTGRQAFVFVAVHDCMSRRGVGLPHHPEVCYTAVGYEIAHAEDLPLDGESDSRRCPRFLHLGREGSQLFVMYWYELNGEVFTTRDTMRTAMWDLRGTREWPPVIKVLLQVSAPNAADAKKQLVDLARPLRSWLDDWSN